MVRSPLKLLSAVAPSATPSVSLTFHIAMKLFSAISIALSAAFVSAAALEKRAHHFGQTTWYAQQGQCALHVPPLPMPPHRQH
jgi:hypothetical protein